MKKRFFLLAFAMVFFLKVSVGNPVYWNVNVTSGLSDNSVKDILRDQFGFVWFATTNGLNRYDGYQFRKYTTIPLGNQNDDVERICEDGTGTIWLTTSDHLYLYDYVSDRLLDHIGDRLARLGIGDSIVWIDTDENRNLWAISRQRIFFYDFGEKRLSVVENTSGGTISQVTSLGGEAYALEESGEFYRIDLHNCRLRYENTVHMSHHYNHFIYLDSRGRLWFYTKHSQTNDLHCYSVSDRTWKNTDGMGPLSQLILTTLQDDGKGNIWAGTENEGIYVFDVQGGVRHLTKNDDAPYQLPSNHISTLYKDQRNTMWIGTSKRGAACLDLTPLMFNVTRFKGREDVSCITEDEQGNLWVGFDGSGLMRIDTFGHETYFNQQNGSLPNDIVTCSLTDDGGRLWVGTFGNGVGYMNGEKFVSYPSHDAEGLQLHYISCMTADSEGSLWFGSIYQGLFCRQKDGDERVFTTANSILKTNSMTCLVSDVDGHLYIGTSTGFYIFDVKNGTFMNGKKGLRSLSETLVTSLYKDSRGLMWVGTRTGLRVYDEHADTLYQITQKEGLSNLYVRAVIEDGSHSVWAGTDNGLTRIVPKKGSSGKYEFVCTPYFEEDGLLSSMFNSNAACRSHSGTCLIGSTNGYLCIRQNAGESAYPPVKVMFTSLPPQTEDIVLAYNQNSFSIDVSAMDYTRKHKIHYLYRLKGGQEEWSMLTGNRINFNALSPGTYTLEVKATDLGGWTSAPSVLKIHVRPPFWLSIPALILYLLLAAASGWVYLKRLKQKHRDTLAIQKLEIELEQQHQMEGNKIRFFTNVSHDLKTPLSLIITPLEKLLSGNLENDLRTELNLMWRNARLLMDGVNQLLDFRRIDVGTEKLQLSHGDFVEFLRKTVEHFRHYSQGKGIQLNLKINVSALEMDFDQNKMRRVLTNLLSNAFKYNKKKGSVTVTVGRTSQNGQPLMRLEVADTGIGIKDENKELIFERFYQVEGNTEYIGSGIGLHIVKEYVTMHQGHVWVEDNHPQGSVFIVTIPITEVAGVQSPSDTEDTDEEVAHSRHTETRPTVDYTNGHEQSSILIVEDNQDFRQFIERCLNDEYRVLTAANGVEALHMLDENDVNIVISDIMMPEMNGLELCNRIKTDVNYSHIPVILLTAKSTEDNIITGLKDGADDYITKPFNLSILKLRIKKILEWTADNHRNFTRTKEIAPSEITVSSLDEQLIERAIKIVEENMNDSEFSVEDFGSAIGLTRSHLYKKLMAITGKSPIEFIRTMRIKRGRSLLEQGRTNISEVAYTVGFSPKQFSKYFKEAYGCLPSEFVSKSHSIKQYKT